MRKAILTLKDQILHKLILIESREPSGILTKYVTEDQLTNMYAKMMVISDNRVILKNINDVEDYKRMNFYYESIIHDYSKKFRMTEDEFKITILKNCNSLNELKQAINYYEFRNTALKEQKTEEIPEVIESRGIGRY